MQNQLREANTMLAWLKVNQVQDEISKSEHTLKLIEQKKNDLSQKTTQKNETQETFSQQLQYVNYYQSLNIIF